VRADLPTADERASELAVLHGRALGLAGWPESLEPVPFRAVDHFGVFGLDGLPAADGVVSELVAGGAVGGEVLAVAGPDLHLATGRGVVVLDTRLMTGWELTAPVGEGDRGALTVPVREARSRGDGSVQDGLF
jgi:hypothetical protein